MGATMTGTPMRKLIAGMKISADGMFEGPKGYADWVVGWSDDYELTPQIDACIVGGAMYPGHEWYWTTILDNPDKPIPGTDTLPTPGEVAWARFATRVPHYVLSSKLSTAKWPNTTFVRRTEDIAALKQEPGKDIYLMGGARTTMTLMDAGLVDEIRLIVYPIIAGEGRPLFATGTTRHPLTLRKAQQQPDGRMSLFYEIG
jgi:dihydrofolate reductase